ncbi:hypothetical protein CHUAL_005278 [Chamberlinius hualienensis]
MATNENESRALLSNNESANSSPSHSSTDLNNQRVQNMINAQQFPQHKTKSEVINQHYEESHQMPQSNKRTILYLCLATTLIITFIIMMATIIGTVIFVMKSLRNIPQVESVVTNIKMSDLMGKLNTEENSHSYPEFLKQPNNLTAVPGSSVFLPCQFDSEVKCFWLRNNELVTNDARYNYESQHATKDCSITINNLKRVDYASWTCGYYEKIHESRKSKEAFIKEDAMFTVKPSNQTVQLGDNTILNCKFNKDVECVWLRNENIVTINDRYSYASGEQHLKSDCSLKIRNVKGIDLASWFCGINSDSNDGNLMSNKIFIKLKSDIPTELNSENNDKVSSVAIKKAPKDATGKAGDQINLECEFEKGLEPQSLVPEMATNENESRALLSNNESANSSPSHSSTDLNNQRIQNMITQHKTISEATSQDKVESQPIPQSNKNTFLLICLGTTLIITFIIMMVTVIGAVIFVMKSVQNIQQVEPTELNVKMSNLIGIPNTEEYSHSQPEFLKQPNNLIAVSGSSVFLSCQLDSEVECFWLRNSELVTNHGRYNYESRHATKDCSITINNLKRLDYASWACGYYENVYKSRQSNEAFITEGTTFTVKPSNKTVQLGDSVSLDCKFSKDAECVWLRNENVVTINDRYSYASGGQHLTSDCSLKIKMATNENDTRALLSNDESANSSRSTSSTDISNQRIQNMINKQQFSQYNTKSEATNQHQVESQSQSNKRTILFICLATTLIITFIIMMATVIGTVIFVTKSIQNIPRVELVEPNVKMSNLIPISNTEKNTNSYPEFLKQPSNLTAVPGSSVFLPCQFDSEVKCFWLRNHELVTNDARYNYESQYATKDCSITINNLKRLDYASWTCGYHENIYESRKSNEAFIKEGATFTVKPINQSVQLGDSVSLDCKFNKDVECVWLRNENVVTINDRYSYASGEQLLKSDCSLKITNVKPIDLASWSCGVISDSNDENLMSNKIVIQIKSDIPAEFQSENNDKESSVIMKKAPKDVTGKAGEEIKLECEFEKGVSCAWLRNENHVEIQGRYSYTNAVRVASDCSITISELKAIDSGKWQCVKVVDSDNGSTLKKPVIVTVN